MPIPLARTGPGSRERQAVVRVVASRGRTAGCARNPVWPGYALGCRRLKAGSRTWSTGTGRRLAPVSCWRVMRARRTLVHLHGATAIGYRRFLTVLPPPTGFEDTLSSRTLDDVWSGMVPGYFVRSRRSRLPVQASGRVARVFGAPRIWLSVRRLSLRLDGPERAGLLAPTSRYLLA